MQDIKHQYSDLYIRFAENPESAKFRRYLELRCWFLNLKSEKIAKQFKACNNFIADSKGVARETSVYTVTDLSRADIEVEGEDFEALVDELEAQVSNFSMLPSDPHSVGLSTNILPTTNDLLIAYKVANLPAQHKIYARHFARTEGLFKGDVYVPTGERASIYSQVPAHSDTCVLKEFQSQEIAPEWVINNIEPINEWLNSVVNRMLRRKVDPDSVVREVITDTTVRTAMNLVAALYAPVLLASSMAVLSCLHSDLLRIVVLGTFGILLTISLMVVVPTIKRSELFAITAAYFAVGGVYIGAKSLNPCVVVA